MTVMLLSDPLVPREGMPATERHIAKARHLNGLGLTSYCYLILSHPERDLLAAERYVAKTRCLHGSGLTTC